MHGAQKSEIIYINDKEERFFLRSGSALVTRGFAERPSRKN